MKYQRKWVKSCSTQISISASIMLYVVSILELGLQCSILISLNAHISNYSYALRPSTRNDEEILSKFRLGMLAKQSGAVKMAIGAMQISIGSGMIKDREKSSTGVDVLNLGFINLLEGLKEVELAKKHLASLDLSGPMEINSTEDKDNEYDQSLRPNILQKQLGNFSKSTGISALTFFAIVDDGKDIFDTITKMNNVDLSPNQLKDAAQKAMKTGRPANAHKLNSILNLEDVLKGLRELKSEDVADKGQSQTSGSNSATNQQGSASASGSTSSSFNYSAYLQTSGSNKGKAQQIYFHNPEQASNIKEKKVTSPRQPFKENEIFNIVRQKYRQKTIMMLGLDEPSVIDQALGK